MVLPPEKSAEVWLLIAVSADLPWGGFGASTPFLRVCLPFSHPAKTRQKIVKKRKVPKSRFLISSFFGIIVPSGGTFCLLEFAGSGLMPDEKKREGDEGNFFKESELSESVAILRVWLG